jgi:hypothetical protein
MAKLEDASLKIPFPLSRETMDARLGTLSGLKLLKWERRDENDDIIVIMELSFDKPATLAAFLDPEGGRAVFTETNGSKTLDLILAYGHATVDPGLKSFIDSAFDDYKLELSFSAPTRVTSPEPATVDRAGTSARYLVLTAELLKSADDIIWTIRW